MTIDYFRTSGVMSTTYDGIDYHPVLKLNFLNSNKLDLRTTFSRTTSATYIDSIGRYALASEETPRLDYDPVTLQKRGLFLEEDATNLVQYSNNPNNPPWSASGPPGVTPLSADGIFTPTRVTSTGVAWHRLQCPTNLTAGTTYAVTVLFKPGTSGKIYTELRFDASNTYVISGSATSPTVTVTQNFSTVLPHSVKVHVSGIHELTYAVTPVTSGFYSLGIGPNSTVSGEYIDLYGAQIEADSAPTSFIVTTTNVSAVNRTRDNCYIGGSGFASLLGSNGATLVVDHVMSSSTAGGGGFIAALYGSSTNYAGLAYNTNSGYNGVNYYNNGEFFNSAAPDASYSGYDRIASAAIAYDATGVESCFSGNMLEHSGTFNGAITPTQLTLGARSQGGDFDSNVWIRRVSLYDRRLPAKDLIYLTSFEL